MKKTIINMPHPGHFWDAKNCNFRLNTYVNGYIVSTLGEYFPSNSNKMEEISLCAFYETMVFKAKKSYYVECCPYVRKNGLEIDSDYYRTAEDAVNGHNVLVKKMKLKKGKKR